MNKKIILIFGMFFLVSIILTSGVFAQSVSWCCEKLLGIDQSAGMWCQNAPQSSCSPLYRTLSTSCEASDYCKPGTCIEQAEGICTANTPKRVCDEKGGYWREEDMDQLPQCQLGCCFIGDQVAFVTQTRCGSLASEYGLQINFRADINNELECIMSSSPKVRGACAYDANGVRDCEMLTKKECNDLQAGAIYENVMFHEGFLCSAPELNTICDPRGGTTCVEGKDEVYFMDTCGNIANVYDADKVDTLAYWTYLTGAVDNVEVECDVVEGDATNTIRRTCGNCDYYSGSTCTKKKFGDDIGTIAYGDYYCRSLDCTEGFDTDRSGVIESDEKNYKHGESWCVISGPDSAYKNNLITVKNGVIIENEILGTAEIQSGDENGVGAGETKTNIREDKNLNRGSNAYEEWKEILQEKFNLPGTRHYRALCFNGEVLIEPCADFRQEICMESATDDFSNAACKLNMWQNCMEQTDLKHCEDRTSRDCVWLPITSQKEEWDKGDRILVADNEAHVCVPAFGPGFATWKEENDAALICARASGDCTTIVKRWGLEMKDGKSAPKRIASGEECIRRGEKLFGVDKGTGEWRESKSMMTWFLGDCGEKKNYMNKYGADLGSMFGAEREPWRSDLY